jgi:hypothetical protein
MDCTLFGLLPTSTDKAIHVRHIQVMAHTTSEAHSIRRSTAVRNLLIVMLCDAVCCAAPAGMGRGVCASPTAHGLVSLRWPAGEPRPTTTRLYVRPVGSC